MKIQINNGKKTLVAPEPTLEDLRKELPPAYRDEDVIVEGSDGLTRIVQPGERLDPKSKYHTIPKIVKGSNEARITAEVSLLTQALGGKSPVRTGQKTVDGVVFTGVLIKNVRLSTEKFKDTSSPKPRSVTKTDMLFLVPSEYPFLPPLGCYLNYQWPSSDHHFTLQSHYGAPHLRAEGWYWYCVGLGGRLGRASSLQAQWRPGRVPEDGHNLLTLFNQARHAINTD